MSNNLIERDGSDLTIQQVSRRTGWPSRRCATTSASD
jgi:hypothetical protein